MTIIECIRILELPPNYTQVQLKKQYRLLVLKYHPDRNQGKTEKKFQQIQLAYTTIKNYNPSEPSIKSRPKSNQTEKNYQDQYFKQQVAAEMYKRKMEHLKKVYEFQKRRENKYFKDYIRNISMGILLTIIFILIILILTLSS